MQLRVAVPGSHDLVPTDTPPTTFPLSTGSIFELHPRDEERRPREVEMEGGSEVCVGAFYHGMQQELQAAQISCGFVFRCVHHARDMDCTTRRVIPTQREVSNKQTMRKFEKARDEWSVLAPQYAALVKERVQAALGSWPWWERPPPFDD